MKITQNYFNQILKNKFLFENNPKVAVAVSGGPDSMALVFLLKRWIKKNNGMLIALIVDHQIRTQSSLEAIKVKKYLSYHNIKSKLFKVNKKDIVKKTMSEARQNRFTKLINFCKTKNIFHLFVAHHYDDNLETYLIRKIAGSNFEGLHAMQLKTTINGLQLIRPLLKFNKIDILNYNKNHNISFVKDPSNFNIKYSRIAVRDFLIRKKHYKKQIEEDFRMIQFYFPFYKKMIFHIFNKLNIKISTRNILIDNINFYKHDQEIQTKIVEIIYKFLMPKRNFLRYSKIVNFIYLLYSNNIIKTNLGGINIKKDAFLISFTV